MKSSQKINIHSIPENNSLGDLPQNKHLKHQVDYYKKEKEILLDLSDAIIKVRDKNDLIKVFASKLKQLFYFTHAVISLIDKKNQTYYPFLYDTSAMHIKHRAELPNLLKNQFFLDDPFIGMVISSDRPTDFPLRKIIKKPGIPAFLKVNYETGIKQAMIVKLKNKMEPIGFVFIYSDTEEPFPEIFKNILQSLSPLLSSAVENIIINDEIKNNEFVTQTLLSLSHDMVTVRGKSDLLNVINTGLKKVIYFSHSVVLSLDENGKTYRAFLTDHQSRIRNLPGYDDVMTMANPINDGIFDVAYKAEKPITIDVKSVNPDNAPLWLKLNYDAGVKELMLKMLPGRKQCLILYSDKKGFFNEESFQIVDRIASQLATAVNNILAYDEIIKREQEKSSLLNFSNDIAAVRTKADLESAINNVFQNVLHIELTMLRVIDDDGIHIPPYIYNKTAAYTKEEIYGKLISTNLTIHEELTERVLLSKDPVVFNIEEEERQGNKGPYIYLWKKAGFKNAYGAPLRVGNTDLGTLWLLTNEVNLNLLKGICSQISIAISNIKTNEKVLALKKMAEAENDHLKDQIKSIYNSTEIIGNGPEMQRLYSMMSLVAPSNSTVLLLGETGTGKELVARAIHYASPRKDRLMIKINCAALPANLIESELFGHEKGSFTGAIERRIGKFEMANNSTLFLDEIGEMPLETQVKLLRVIQERELERIGGKSTIKVDVRIIAATNRNIEDEVKAGRFRSDLYYRLNVFPINLPPLRKRMEDIEPLANFFLARYSKNTGKKVFSISPQVIKKLKGYLWPGNVRELEHLIERSVLLSQESVLNEVQLPKTKVTLNEHPFDIPSLPLREIERSYIIETLKRCDGKIAGTGGAAEILDIPSTTLHSKMLKLNISKADYFVKRD